MAEDHPRVCGENASTWAVRAVSSGSPPRVRGKPDKLDKREGSVRITPACAGKTGTGYLTVVRHGDHPRVCGENLVSYLPPFMTEGSPPRVRGKLRCSRRLRVLSRITPACAGKTICRTRSDVVLWGSPPRVRGKLARGFAILMPFRITPACAGKTITKIFCNC